MRSVLSKIPAMIAMIFALMAFIGIALLYFIVGPRDQGAGLALLGLEFFFFASSLFLYAIDAVLSIIKSCMGISPLLNAALAASIILEILFFAVFFTPLNKIITVSEITMWVWALWYTEILVLEIISIVKHIKTGHSRK